MFFAFFSLSSNSKITPEQIQFAMNGAELQEPANSSSTLSSMHTPQYTHTHTRAHTNNEACLNTAVTCTQCSCCYGVYFCPVPGVEALRTISSLSLPLKWLAPPPLSHTHVHTSMHLTIDCCLGRNISEVLQLEVIHFLSADCVSSHHRCF